MDERFTLSTYLVRRKIFKLFGRTLYIYNPQHELIFFTKMKAFKLKEDIRLYTDKTKQTELLVIKARHIIDFSAVYDVYDPSTNEKVGALKRKGFNSILRDKWLFFNNQDQEIGAIEEDNMILALLRRFLLDIIPQNYYATINGKEVCSYRQNFNPFVLKLKVDFSSDTEHLLDKRLGIAAAVLLCAIEGRQN